MLPELDKRLEEIRLARREKQRLAARLEDSQGRLDEERALLAGLEARLEQEGRDVARLEGLSLQGLFYTVLGSKEEQLDKERQEVLAAKLKLDRAKFTVSSLESEVAALEKQLVALGDTDLQYEAVMRQKEQALAQQTGEIGQRISQLGDEAAAARAEQKELQEALNAGQAARTALENVLASLQSASNWGVWDMLGGGLLATAAKHSRVDDARQEAYQAGEALRRFQREMADVQTASPLVVDISSLDTFADFFLDGLIFDWIVQSKINASFENAAEVHRQVTDSIEKLIARLTVVDARVSQLAEEKQRLIEKA